MKNILLVGAGPAGCAIMGQLLKQKDEKFQLYWVDPEFNGGRLSIFPNVPSNTKSGLFKEFGNIFGSQVIPNSLMNCPIEECCPLAFAYQLVKSISDSINDGRVQKIYGKVAEITRSNPDCKWNAVIRQNSGADLNENFDLVILAIGSKPREPPIMINSVTIVDSEALLNPNEIYKYINSKDNVAVVGASHTAILILKNLHAYQTATSPDTILVKPKLFNFHRPGSLVFAEYRIDGSIIHDNTGLKGLAADWAKKYLLDGAACNRISVADDEELKEAVDMHKIDKLVWAIGYKCNQLPLIRILDGSRDEDGATFKTVDYKSFKGDDGTFNGVSDLYGIGIAFPQKVREEGRDVDSVGMWKFMNFAEIIVDQIFGKRYSQILTA